MEQRFMIRGLVGVLAMAGILITTCSTQLWAVGFSSHGTKPPQPSVDVDCTKATAVLKSREFHPASSRYEIEGFCTTKVWVGDVSTAAVIPGPSFTVVGTWDANTKEAKETISLSSYAVYNDFTETLSNVSKSKIFTSAACPYDPWVNDGVSCTGSTASQSADSPADALKIFTEKHGKHYPASMFLVPSAKKADLRRGLKMLPPVIKSPTSGQKVIGNVNFEAEVNPKTKTFLKEKPNWDIEAEFIEVSPGSGHQVWTADLVNGTAKKSIPLPAHKYQVHARARGPQFNTGDYSGKISFEVSGLAQDCATLSPPPSIPDSKAGATISAAVYFTNCGTRPWAASTSGNAIGPVNLSYHWYDAAGVNQLIPDGLRTPLIMQPGQTGNVNAQILMPPTPGTYTLKWDVVYENHFWFSQPPALLKYGGFGNMSPKVKVK